MSTWFIITHSETPVHSEKKFSNSATIAQVKVCHSPVFSENSDIHKQGALYPVTGTPDSRMKLQLKDEDGEIIADDMDNNKKLEDYDIFDHAILHVCSFFFS